MIELLAAGTVLGLGGLVIWLALWSAERAGAAEERAKEAEHAVENAERVAAAVADAPRDADDLAERVRDGSWKL